jgi:hypothetical protein
MNNTEVVTYTFWFNIATAIIFSIIYAFIGQNNFEKLNRKEQLTYLDYIFYSVTIQSGVGLPDVTAVSVLAKFLALIQQLILMTSAYILLILFFKNK